MHSFPDTAVTGPSSEPAAAAVPSLRSVGGFALAVGSLGVVFGDIGTSPLYALQAVFVDHHIIPLTAEAVHGVISMVFWSITLVVSLKYVLLVMRADNAGEGGILALVAMVKRLLGQRRPRLTAFLVALGVLGAALFFGNALVTPAISVLAAVGGLKSVSPSLGSLVLPVSLVIICLLFAVQRFGTSVIGRFFGPVCALWFAVIAAGGLAEVLHHPAVLQALSPVAAASFMISHPAFAFAALAGVVLVITGAEALFADMGHFGRPAISRAWFFVVFPALTLNYLGQGAFILYSHSAADPFFGLFPHGLQLPLVLLATAATVIASQAVISGAFTMARQASQLGFLPRLIVRHTSSSRRGQVYAPLINYIIFAAVIVLILGFRTSTNLAGAYGLAVTGTIAITTVLFLFVARERWHLPRTIIAVGGLIFLSIDLSFFAANLPKLATGGWFSVAVAIIVFVIFTTWDRGRLLISRARVRQGGSLQAFVARLHAPDSPVRRVPGTGIFLTANPAVTPLCLRGNVERNRALHESTVVVSVEISPEPHLPLSERVREDNLGYTGDGIFHLTLTFGFNDRTNVPAAISLAVKERRIECPVDLADAQYFVSQITLARHRRPHHSMAGWRKALFLQIARHAADPIEYFHLPPERTVIMGQRIII